MSEWDSFRTGGGGTWGDLIAHAGEFGVTVQTLESITYADDTTGEAKYLHRVYAGEVLTYPMPKNCTPERKLGFGRMALICSRLKIAEPRGWPIAF